MYRRQFGWMLAVLPAAGCQQDQQPVTRASPVPASVPAAPVAPREGGHWLLGTWRGTLVGMRTGEPGRTLVVSSVDPAGTAASGRWAGANVDIRITGNTVRFFTGAHNPVELAYAPPGTLEGTPTNAEGGGPRAVAQWAIRMQRA